MVEMSLHLWVSIHKSNIAVNMFISAGFQYLIKLVFFFQFRDYH